MKNRRKTWTRDGVAIVMEDDGRVLSVGPQQGDGALRLEANNSGNWTLLRYTFAAGGPDRWDEVATGSATEMLREALAKATAREKLARERAAIAQRREQHERAELANALREVGLT